MRLPNSYGSIVKLSGKRRRPYAVRITTGWTDEGRQIQKYLSYHATRREAMAALAEYNKAPFDLDNQKITFAEMYERWLSRNADNIDRVYIYAYNHLSELYQMPFIEIRKRHIQAIIDTNPLSLSVSSLNHMKTLCSFLFKYAMDMELVTANQASGVELPTQKKSKIHHPFSLAELDTLWQHTDDFAVCMAIVLSYTGLRPSELLEIKTENVFLAKRYMIGGLKTPTSRDRTIPLADKILPFINDLYAPTNKYLVTRNGRNLTYSGLQYLWKKSPIIQNLPTKHLPHDGRHTCATLLANKEVDLKTRKLILGHRDDNITDYIYTHKTLEQLLNAINSI